MPFEHALVLVKNLMMTKTENMELCAYIKELHAQMNEAGLQVPPQKKPESTDDKDSAYDSEDDDSDFTDSDEELAPVAGNGLLEQIFNLQN